ncbi:MAG: helix-turn-helix domain-containing protein [Bacteroidota bacterium]
MSIIKEIREQLGYTQLDLSKKAKLSLRTIQRLEASNMSPKGHTLTVLSTVFNMTPEALQRKFNAFEKEVAADSISIRLLNLSVLSFLAIPFGNIILPFILWKRKPKSKLVDEIGRRIINFQILFSVILSLSLCLSPFLGRQLFPKVPIIPYVLFAAYVFNIAIICRTALKLNRNDFDILKSSFRFI